MTCQCKNPLDFVRIKVITKSNQVTRVFVRFSGTNCCDVSVDMYLAKMAHVYENKHPFVVLYDATMVGKIPMTLINKQALFMRKYDNQTRDYLKRCAIILTSEWARMTLKLLFTLKPPACPLETFPNIYRAKEWLKVVTG
jgi:hypothetical protein